MKNFFFFVVCLVLIITFILLGCAKPKNNSTVKIEKNSRTNSEYFPPYMPKFDKFESTPIFAWYCYFIRLQTRFVVMYIWEDGTIVWNASIINEIAGITDEHYIPGETSDCYLYSKISLQKIDNFILEINKRKSYEFNDKCAIPSHEPPMYVFYCNRTNPAVLLSSSINPTFSTIDDYESPTYNLFTNEWRFLTHTTLSIIPREGKKFSQTIR